MFLRFFTMMILLPLWLAIAITGALGTGVLEADVGSGALRMLNLRFEADNARTRLIATFNANPQHKLMILANPPRLVIDLPATVFATPADKVEVRGLVDTLRYGLNGAGGARIVIDLHAPFDIDEVNVEALYDGIWQMVIELQEADRQSFAAALGAWQTSSDEAVQAAQDKAAGTSPSAQDNSKTRAFTVMIDAGHGGFDSGAEGVGGVLEKDVTLAFAHALRETLQHKAAAANIDIAIHLTREEDEFLRLSQRVAKARAYHADLFISIHADSIHLSSLRGATVYTLSDQASDALARAIADNENKAELLDGLPADELGAVTDILLDLTRHETDAFSRRFADQLIVSLRQGNIRLIKDPHRYAGFMVLRVPDIPSILLELGYLSNESDEKLISDPAWRQKMTTLIADSVLEFSRLRR